MFVALDRIYIRKGFDVLAGIVQHQLGLDPINGHIVLFVNKRGNLMKLLFFDRIVWAVLYSDARPHRFLTPEESELPLAALRPLDEQPHEVTRGAPPILRDRLTYLAALMVLNTGMRRNEILTDPPVGGRALEAWAAGCARREREA